MKGIPDRPLGLVGLIRLSVGMALTFLVAVFAAPASAQVIATGGDLVQDIAFEGTEYRVHVYTNPATTNFDVETGGPIEILLVGGGGGGGFGGGGGGAGGFVLTNLSTEAGSNYTVVVGIGGAGRKAASGEPGSNGQHSVFGSITAIGGGGGGSAGALNGQDGGSGGGAARATTLASGGNGTPGQGHNGGTNRTVDVYPAGGGGGALTAGATPTGNPGGAGGAGTNMTYWLLGLALGDNGMFAGGGGGGTRSTASGGAGGSGGGGKGGGSGEINGANALRNTGGGGGGGGQTANDWTSHDGGDGGSGIVIVRYAAPGAPFYNLDAMTLADVETGSTQYTTTNEVRIVSLPSPADYLFEGYDQIQFTEDGNPDTIDPDGWMSTNAIPEILSFMKPAGNTNITLYAWFTNSTASVMSLRSAGSILYVADVDLRIWIGTGADALASTLENWAGGIAPATGHHIRFDDSHLGNAWTNATWNLEIEPASWTQTVDYAGTVTIQTKYPGQGSSFTNLTITGDVTLEGGTWTHESNPHTHEVYRLAVTVGGDFTLDSNAVINITMKGYGTSGTTGRGPGGASRYTGSSYGGLGSGASWDKVYGSVTSPTNLGSSSFNSPGGGALLLNVDQIATIDGEISANGGPGSNSGAGSSGGSIFLVVGELAGGGVLEASGSGQWNTRNGGGGRIAVHLKNSDSFGAVRMRAYGGGQSSADMTAAAGTIYRRAATQNEGEGTLVIDNNGFGSFDAMTMLPPDAPNLDHFSGIILTNRGWLALNTDTVYDWISRDNLSTYGPAASTLTVRNTNTVSMPTSHWLTDMTLNVMTNMTFAEDFMISNATLVVMGKAPDPGLTVGGDMILFKDGTISHWAYDEAYRLILEVGNNLIIHDGGRIHADGIGFPRGSGPGYGSSANSNTRPAASHGGQGTPNPGLEGQPVTYGSIFQPVRYGSGAYAIGGGALQVTVTGTTVLNGEITASPVGGLADGAGGSIWLTTGNLEGNGHISARAQQRSGGTEQHRGGGGRIAVHVTQGANTGDVTMDALGGSQSISSRPLPGAAGTIYVETAAQRQGWGTIRVDNYNISWGTVVQSETNITTQLPPDTEWPDEDLSWTKLEIDRLARVSLTSDLTLRDLYILHPDARLHLNGYTLRLRSPYHDDWGLESNVVYDGGEIIWAKRGTIFTFR